MIKRIASVFLLAVLVISCAEESEEPTDFRQEYLGVWDVTEKTGINAPQIYSVQISEGNGENDIIIKGLYNLSAVEVNAEIDKFTFSIPEQTSEGVTFSGSGTANVDFDQLNLNFTANDGSGNDDVNAVFTR